MKVLIVEDSATVAAYVSSVLRREPDFDVLPVASTAEQGVRQAVEQSPDVILMDVKLPDQDGVWAIGEIMAERPAPVIVLSGHLDSSERDIPFESLRAGAVDVVAKLTSFDRRTRADFEQNLIKVVRLMASAIVVRRQRLPRTPAAVRTPAPFPYSWLTCIEYLLVGSSTGGPQLLHALLSAVPHPFPLPILITQHTLEGFDTTLAEWLSQTGHVVRVAQSGDTPRPGRVLLAPADGELEVTRECLMTHRRPAQPDLGSIDVMFGSAATAWGHRCLALQLTGMGRDGVRGLRALQRAEAITLAQHPDSCVVASMPEAAIAAGAVRRTVRPEEMIDVFRYIAEEGVAGTGNHYRALKEG